MLTPRPIGGFTLIELLVALTLAAILLALGAPAMSQYLQIAKVGASTQSLHAGLQAARTEAIRRNRPVEFVLTNMSVTATNIASAVVASSTGVNWVVRAASGPASAPEYDLVDAKAAAESAGGDPTSVVIAASGAFPGTLTFNGFGGVTAPTTFTVRHLSAPACPGAGAIRCRLVRISGGGQVSTCDPDVTNADDTRFCRP